MTPSRTSPRLAVVLGTSLLLVAGCTGSGSGSTGPPAAGALQLVAFDSCEQAAQQLRGAAREYIGPWPVDLAAGADLRARGADGAADSAAGAPAPGAAAGPEAGAAAEPGGAAPAADPPSYSGTNVHEAGVDEPDLVKTDGRRIVTVTGDTLRVIDAAQQAETGTLRLRDPVPEAGGAVRGMPAELLLAGDRALVLREPSWRGGTPLPGFEARPGPGVEVDPDGDPDGDPDQPPAPAPIHGPSLLLVDLTGEPEVVGEYTVDGNLVDARAVGSTARVVVRSAPRLAFPAFEPDVEPAERLAANRAVVDTADLADWLPRYRATAGGETETGQVPCTAVSRPADYSGTSMLTVLTFDLTDTTLGDGEPVSVVADGDTVYSNGSSLYVASDRRWRIMPGRAAVDLPGGAAGSGFVEPGSDEADRTDVYKFDIPQDGPPRFAAAGSVSGWLLNQYAMSEWEGHLRLATTTGQSWGEDADSESTVYVLAEDGDELVEVGSVGGLGKTERIHSVRFAGPIGYVVTFRETDPLYTVDLSDPAAPVVLGELKITGYSAYLHPIDGDRLIGVGQEADQQGRTLGTQVSLFDVSDLSDPVLHAQHHVEQGRSEAEVDPHAFLWWPDERLLVIPLQVLEPAAAGAPGALVLRVDDAGFTELAQLSHQQPQLWPGPGPEESYSGAIRRSLVVDGTLWTVSDLGMQANSLASFERSAWISFR